MNLKIPKYSIGQKVFIIDKAKLVKRFITTIKIKMVSENECFITYRFKGEDAMYVSFTDGKPESEVFESKEEFIKSLS